MSFASLRYFVFLAAVLVLLRLVRGSERQKVVLAVASCLFYAAWDYRYLALLLLVSGIDYACGAWIASSSDARVRRFWLAVSIVSNLGILGYFKYYGFMAGNLRGLGFDIPFKDILLPAGISFYTFKSMSYTIDVYWRHITATRHWRDYVTFVTFFPELIAGPIVRASAFLPQMSREIGPTSVRLRDGLSLFLIGLTKKVLVADHLAPVADQVFANPAIFSTMSVWAGVLAYSFQIYCDFSGYSDMAIGTAKMIGYDLPENFNMPYLSASVAEFWLTVHVLGAHEGIDLGLVGQFDARSAVGKIVAVETDIDRQHHVVMLGDLEGHDGGVEHLLHRFAVHLHPAHLAHRHRILMAAPDRLRRDAVAGDDGHDDGQSHSRRAEIWLEHESQTGAAGRGISPRPGQCPALQHGKHGMLAFGVNDIGIHAAIGDQFGNVLDEGRLWRDRIHRNHVGTRQGDAQRSCFVTFAEDDFLLRRPDLIRCFQGGGSHAASEL